MGKEISLERNIALNMDRVIAVSVKEDGSIEYECANGEIHVLYNEPVENIDEQLMEDLARIFKKDSNESTHSKVSNIFN